MPPKPTHWVGDPCAKHGVMYCGDCPSHSRIYTALPAGTIVGGSGLLTTVDEPDSHGENDPNTHGEGGAQIGDDIVDEPDDHGEGGGRRKDGGGRG